MTVNIDFPQNKEELNILGWDQTDFVLVTGDAFVDHSSYGAAIIARVLKNRGYRIGVISQPEWKTPKAIQALGIPRLGFMVTSGNMDSMVNHYTVNKKRRRQDAYTPGGIGGKRPNRAVITYCGLIRQAFGSVPIILGGIEASLRRFAHYDYWQDRVRRPILMDSQANLLVYGMGEKAVVEVAEALDAGLPIDQITYIRGTAYLCESYDFEPCCVLPSYTEVASDKVAFASAAASIQGSNDPFSELIYVQPVDGQFFIQNPAQYPLTEMEMDDVYELPYTNTMLTEGEMVPSFNEVEFSVTANRGCFGSCSFCALAIHQGRYIQKRSKRSILDEIRRMTKYSEFKGYIHDIGGPTANFRNLACQKQKEHGVCRNRECLFPKPCPNIDCDESEYCSILKEARSIPGVKKVFVRSGIRYDYLMKDKSSSLFKELVSHHISGQLRVAPEHVSDSVLYLMGKPRFSVYERFCECFEKETKKIGKEQYIVPYFISSHPGSTLEDAIAMSEYFRDHHMIPEQVQDFYPTPGSLATAMYYTELDPITMQSVYVPKGHEKQLQRALLQYNNPKNHELVKEALLAAGRNDLIGTGSKVLLYERNVRGKGKPYNNHKSSKHMLKKRGKRK